MGKKLQLYWQKMALWRRLMLLLVLGLLGSGLIWVGLAGSTDYTNEDTYIEEAFELLDVFSSSTNACVWVDTNTSSWAWYLRWGDPAFTDGNFILSASPEYLT